MEKQVRENPGQASTKWLLWTTVAVRGSLFPSVVSPRNPMVPLGAWQVAHKTLTAVSASIRHTQQSKDFWETSPTSRDMGSLCWELSCGHLSLPAAAGGALLSQKARVPPLEVKLGALLEASFKWGWKDLGRERKQEEMRAPIPPSWLAVLNSCCLDFPTADCKLELS